MKNIFSFLITLFFTTAVFAQQLQLITYDIDEGLSRGLIKSMITDDVGFVWSATDEGVIRFDGQNSVFFREFLPGGFAKAFYKRNNGQFLVVHDRGVLEIISKADTTYFRDYLDGLTEDSDTSLYYPKILYEDRRNQLWIGESQSVVKYVDGQLKKYRFSPEERGNSFQRNFSFAEDGQGRLWTISYTGHVFRYDSGQDQFERVPIATQFSEVSFLTSIDSQRFFLGAREGLFELKIGGVSDEVQINKLADIRRASCGILIEENEFYVGSFDSGLYRVGLEEKEVQLMQVEDLPFEDVMNLYFDANGLWVCSSEAISLLHPVFFGKINLGNSLDQIESVKMAADSSIVIASGLQVNLLKQTKNGWAVAQSIAAPSDKAAMQAWQDGKGVWIGGFTGAVHYYNLPTQTMTLVGNINLRHDYMVSDIMQDKNKNIWISGNKQDGLIRLDSDRRLHRYADDGLTNNTFVKESAKGQIFCGGKTRSSYLYRYDSASDQFDNMSIDLPFEIDGNFLIYDLLIENEKELLLGSNHGLLRYEYGDTLAISRIDLEIVPLEEPVRALVKDRNNTLWVATTKGLLKYEKNNPLLFNPTSGLPSRTLMPRALLIDYDNDLWVGTARGLSHYQSDQLRPQSTPKPIFTALMINGHKVNPESAEVRRFPFRTYLEANFISLSFPGDRIKYQYRIIEQDSNWSEPSAKAQLFFSAFEPDTYTLQIRAQQHGGLEWSAPLSYRFTINPAWSQRWWALLLFFLAGVGLIAGAVKLYNRRLIQHNELLEKLVRERTREIHTQKNQIIEHQNEIIEQKEELLRQNELVLQTQQALAKVEHKNQKLKEERLQQEIKHKNKQLTTVSLHIIQKNKTLKDLGKEIGVLSNSSPIMKQEVRKLQKLIDESFRLDRDWDEFKLYFEKVYVDFYKNLKKKYPNLTNSELRHCALIKLNLSINECANILGISPESVKISRFRLKKKMDLTTQNEVRDCIMSL